MYTQAQINAMNTEQLRAALAATLREPATASAAAGQAIITANATMTSDDLKRVLQNEVTAAIVRQQPVALAFTESFLEKHQVSPQIAAAIAIGAIGGIVEIIKALLPILFQ
jgi:hypothetical protein